MQGSWPLYPCSMDMHSTIQSSIAQWVALASSDPHLPPVAVTPPVHMARTMGLVSGTPGDLI